MYENCESFLGIYKEIIFYTPKNVLDTYLYKSHINSEVLKKDNIIISETNNMDSISCYSGSFYIIGNICLHNDNYNKCNECDLFLPFDLDFYSNKTNE